MIPDPDRITRDLLAWYGVHGRTDLPWRRTYHPYHILVSEVMLQQTQSSRAAAYFERFLERFPSLDALAAADQDQVLLAWEGLGYYARARNLRAAARIIIEEHGGRVPSDPETLRTLPGIGPYTSATVAAIAHNVDAVVVDANVERVLSRLFDIDAPVKSPWAAGHIRHLAGRLTPSGRARDAVQALMEFGARVCRPRNPACAGCPLAGDCQALRLGITEHRPVPGKARAATPLDIVAGILFHQGRVFIQKRPEHLVWGGLWEFPGGRVEPGEDPAAACVREFAEETELAVTVLAPVAVIRHAYTTYRVRLHGFTCALAGTVTRPVLHAALECRWVGFQDLADHPFPAAHRKLADALARKGVPG